MGPYGVNLSVQQLARAEMAEDEDGRLNAARDSFPHWRIIELGDGGYAAVHAEAVYLEALSLDALVCKLRKQ